jgi:pyridine nucleotide-disulfide oxidoreductase
VFVLITDAGTTEGLVKLVFRSSDRRLLGAHILGEGATELIHIAHAMLHSGATVHDFIDTTFNFPTRADAYKYAAYDALGHLEARVGIQDRRRANASRRGRAARGTARPALSKLNRAVMPARRASARPFVSARAERGPSRTAGTSSTGPRAPSPRGGAVPGRV